jgi:hypothetical protein
MDTNDLFTLAIATGGLVLSLVSLWLQYRVSPPLVALQNTVNAERCVLLTREKLPEGLSRFPKYQFSFPGCVILSLIWGNAGDKVGLVDVRGIIACSTEEDPEPLAPEASYYNFVIVPGRSAVAQEVVLWNLPSEEGFLINLDIDYVWGSPDRKTGRFKEQSKEVAKVSIRVITGRT